MKALFYILTGDVAVFLCFPLVSIALSVRSGLLFISGRIFVSRWHWTDGNLRAPAGVLCSSMEKVDLPLPAVLRGDRGWLLEAKNLATMKVKAVDRHGNHGPVLVGSA